MIVVQGIIDIYPIIFNIQSLDLEIFKFKLLRKTLTRSDSYILFCLILIPQGNILSD
jgi:hypothetical protein